MNLTDLRDELDLHALDIKADTSSLAAGVAGKVRATKRRRAASGVVAAFALATMAGVGLWSGPDRAASPAPAVSRPVATVGEDGLPSRVVPDAPGDVVKGGLRYRAQVADDRLVAGFIGDEGQGQFTLVWEPKTTHVSISSECYLPGVDPDTAARTMLRVSLGSAEGFFASQCQSRLPENRDLPAGGVVPGEPGQGWSELTVGRTAELRVQLVDSKGRPTQVDGAVIAAAVYELGEQHAIQDASGRTVGVIPQVVEHEGYRYLLEPVVGRPLGAGALPKLQAPSSGPYVVSFGTVGTGAPNADPGYFRLDGLAEDSSLVQEGGLTTAPQAAGSGQTLTLELAEGSAPKVGYGVIAVYVPIR